VITNNSVKWKLFIVSNKLNNLMIIKIGVNELTVNDSEMCVRLKRSLVNGPTGDISPEIA